MGRQLVKQENSTKIGNEITTKRIQLFRIKKGDWQNSLDKLSKDWQRH